MENLTLQEKTNPDKFAVKFNSVMPEACRTVTTQDVLDMTECGLLKRHGYFIWQDLETVRGILQYEQLQQNRQKRDEIRDSDSAIQCRRCGSLLTAQPDGKKGRPREYCPSCEPFRARERHKAWWRKRASQLQPKDNSIREVSNVR